MRAWLRYLSALALIVGSVFFGAGGASAQVAEDLTVAIEPGQASVVLGQNLDLKLTVTNTGSQATAPLVIHLDITDPSRTTSVDPEDWTSTLSKPIGVLAADDTLTLDWNIQPISGGTFAVYAVALSPGADTLSTSYVTTVKVQDKRSLNPSGILPVAVGVPCVVGALLLLQLRLTRTNKNRRAREPLYDLLRHSSLTTPGLSGERCKWRFHYWFSAAGIRSAKVIANAFRAGFHRTAHRV